MRRELEVSSEVAPRERRSGIGPPCQGLLWSGRMRSRMSLSGICSPLLYQLGEIMKCRLRELKNNNTLPKIVSFSPSGRFKKI